MTDEEKLLEQQKRLSEQQQELLKKLRAIGSDIWGGLSGGAEAPSGEAAGQTSAPSPAPEAGQMAAAEKTKKREVLHRPEVTLDNLWMTADETIDWTEALSRETPADGLTGQELWRFYHEQAEQVLRGNVAAYARVLRKTNPLGELTAYADGMTMRAPSAERVEGSFTCREELLRQHGAAYLASMGLRIARDLFACLPVTEVGVTAYQNGEKVLKVTYPRDALRHVAFSFINPVELTERCGGIIRTEAAQ